MNRVIASVFVLIYLTELAVGSCPAVCRCFQQPEGLNVVCSSRTVPVAIPLNTSRLTLNDLDIQALPDNALSNLTLLLSLKITGKIRMIVEKSFSGLISLEELILVDVGILVIDAGAFLPLVSIKLLNLYNNPDLQLSGVELSFHGLRNSSIDNLFLDKINVHDYILKPSFFIYLENTTLKTITLSHNQIAVVEPGLSRYIRHVEKLVMSHNYIVGEREVLVELVLFKELRFLDLSYQRTLDEDKRFILSEYRKHRNISPPLQSYNQTKIGTFGKREIDPSCSGEFIVPFPPKLEYFYVQYFSRGPVLLRKTCFDPNNSLKKLDAAGLYLHSMDGPFIGFNHLEYISIDNCQCHKLPPNFAEYMPAMKVLKVGNNRLSPLIQGDVNGSLFRKNKKLQVLDIKNNGIIFLPKSLLDSVRQISVFDLSRNNISSIGYFDNFRNLTYINFSSNNISTISEKELVTFDKIASHNNLSVSLDNNPVTMSSHCCDVQIFISWTLKTKVHLPDLHEYKCVSPYGYYVRFNEQTSDSVEHLCKKTPLNVIVVVLVIITVIFLVTFGSLMYRYRWKVRWLAIISKRFLKLQEETRDTTVYDYDAFVSFNVDDIIWVQDKLIVELEQKRNLELCIHQRDFTPGMPIEENIVDAIERSRKVTIVLSANFVKSNWCHFEVHMARNKLIEKGYDIIVPVILERFDLNLTSRTLRNVLDKNTYLTWDANDVEAQEHFWWQLSEGIKGVHTNALLEN